MLRYSVAVLLVTVATIITWTLQAEQARTPFAFYFIAVVVATLYGGRGPGLTAIALSAIASTYFILPPRFDFRVGYEGLLQLGVFLFVALVISSIAERARGAEQHARRSEASLRTTLRSIGDAVIATNERGCITFMNPVAQNLTGWKIQDAKGKELTEIFHIINEHSRQPVENPVAKVLREGAVVGLANHTVLIARDGRETPIDDSGAPIKDEEGRVTGVVLVFHDITERRLGEEAALRLAALVESSDDAIFGKTLDGQITSWNRAAQRLYGYSAEEVVGRNVSILVPPERLEELRGIMENLKSGERIEHFETVRRRKDGTLIDVSLSISPIKNDLKEIIGAATIARDITERKRTDEALRESEERFRILADSAPVLIWVNGLQGCEFVNSSYLEYLGRSLNEVLNMDWSEAIHPEDVEQYVEKYLRAFERREPLEAQFRFRRADGEYRWFKSIGLPRVTADGKFLGYVGSSVDITDIKASEEALRESEERFRNMAAREHEARIESEEANRLKDEFLATLSHELRTPLTAMLGWTRMLRMRQLDEQTSHHALATIERNVRAQTQLIEDLLDVSRIITGKLRLDTRPVELVPVIEAAIDSIKPAAEAKEITLERVLDPTAGPVLGDPARLQQVVWNLLSNAVKFTPKGGLVRVTLGRSESSAAVTVTDTGAGISHDFLPYVFDRFRQADSSSTRSHGGLGLGLAIARHLVELHGGTVGAQSDGHQRGASFTVRLPLMAVNFRRTEKTDAGDGAGHKSGVFLECPPALKGVRVLVVDDEADARQLLSTILGHCEAVVETAASASEAIEAVKLRLPDLLISDIGMPDEDGYGLLQRLRGDDDPRLKELPAVALTAYASEEDRARSIEAGFQLHLAKPVDPEALIEAVARLIKKDNS